ncbi:hypothetical protein BDZ94DRAFT_1263327 [Collybia nuda]|uniref:F-box domain-containing protein n=1 Tax=Collybia nuda TaxID=64659 RepID=A0A9P5Y4V5_9AGAR|nr:hypothetical protein BDZ94DRAFT_1263327 [Collybia nuda]
MDEEALRRKLKASIGLSNEILSDEEEYIALKLLQESYERVSSIDAEIARIRRSPQHLTKKRAAETEWIARLRAGMSAQKKIPAEILGLIFKIYVDDEKYELEIPPYPGSLSFVLSHVCSRWRQIVLAETSLWNTLFINNPQAVPPEVLEEILLRAGYAITLHLVAENIPLPILRILREYSDRFRMLHFRYDTFQTLGVQPLEIPFERLETLQSLVLTILGNEDVSEPLMLYNMVSVFAHAPNVQQLSIQQEGYLVDLDLGIHLAPFPWFHLQHLEIECGMSLSGLLHIISQCTELISYVAIMSRDNDIRSPLSETQPGIFTLGNLKSLKLGTLNVQYNKVLDVLIAPSLQVLKIDDHPIELDTFLHFIQRSGCSIHTLHVGLTRDSALDIEELMRAIPTAVELSLRGPSTLSESVVESLCTRTLLPNIEVLDCWAGSCRLIKKLASNRCEPKPDNSLKVMRKLAISVWSQSVTDEWWEYQASLPLGEIVQILLVLS